MLLKNVKKTSLRNFSKFITKNTSEIIDPLVIGSFPRMHPNP